MPASALRRRRRSQLPRSSPSSRPYPAPGAATSAAPRAPQSTKAGLQFPVGRIARYMRKLKVRPAPGARGRTCTRTCARTRARTHSGRAVAAPPLFPTPANHPPLQRRHTPCPNPALPRLAPPRPLHTPACLRTALAALAAPHRSAIPSSLPCPAQTTKRVGAGAPVYLAAVLEYLAAEVLELAGNVAKEAKKKKITPRHVLKAIKDDKEFEELLCRVCCPASPPPLRAASAFFFQHPPHTRPITAIAIPPSEPHQCRS